MNTQRNRTNATMKSSVTPKAVTECLHHYPSIGSVAAVTPAADADWHGHNAVFRVACETGEFYLKVMTTHPRQSTEEHYEFQAWAMEHYQAMLLQTPVVQRNRECARVTPCAGYPAVLTAAVKGDAFHEEVLAQQG